jgi:hypothetical protein
MVVTGLLVNELAYAEKDEEKSSNVNGEIANRVP